MTAEPGEPPRAVQGDRENAVQRIQAAYAAGEISHEEMDDRLTGALTARTRGDLVAAVDRLPALPSPVGDGAVNITAMAGRIRRTGRWRVPSVLRIESDYSSVRLDFTQAVFEASVVDVELRLRFGRARLLLPAAAVVDLDGLTTVWKQPRYPSSRQPRVRPEDTASVVLVRVSGVMEFGRLTIKHRRR